MEFSSFAGINLTGGEGGWNEILRWDQNYAEPCSRIYRVYN